MESVNRIEAALEGARKRFSSNVRLTSLGKGSPSLLRARFVVEELRGLSEGLNRASGLDEATGLLVAGSTLGAAFPAVATLINGRVGDAVASFHRQWAERALALSKAQVVLPSFQQVKVEPRAGLDEWLLMWTCAVEEYLRERAQESSARATLRRMITGLELSFEELGRAFSVTGETVRRWERGETPVPARRIADITRADAMLDRLRSLIRPSRLPAAVRRKAELFDGESALEWFLAGRFEAVAEGYEQQLRYQV